MKSDKIAKILLIGGLAGRIVVTPFLPEAVPVNHAAIFLAWRHHLTCCGRQLLITDSAAVRYSPDYSRNLNEIANVVWLKDLNFRSIKATRDEEWLNQRGPYDPPEPPQRSDKQGRLSSA